MNTTGNRIRAARLAARLSQAELAAEIGLDQSNLSRIENGDRSIRVEDLLRIAKALRVSAASLLGDEATAA